MTTCKDTGNCSVESGPFGVKREREPINSEWSVDFRFGAHSGLKLDIAPCLRRVESCRSDRPVSMSALAVCSPEAAGPLPASYGHSLIIPPVTAVRGIAQPSSR